MSSRPAETALLLVGLALVTAPLWAPALDLTGVAYEYRATEVTATDSSLSVADPPPFIDGVDGFDCWETRIERECVIAAAQLDGPVRARYPGVEFRSGDPADLLRGSDRYVVFGNGGRVYERTTRYNDTAGAFELGLRPANASAVLADVAVTPRRDPVRLAVERGTARAEQSLDEAKLVETGEGYALVWAERRSRPLVEQPFAERVVEAMAVALGLALLWRAWRKQVAVG